MIDYMYNNIEEPDFTKVKKEKVVEKEEVVEETNDLDM